MGNLQSCAEENICGSLLGDPSDRIIASCDFESWKTSKADFLGFSSPCLDYHTIESVPYSSEKCYMIEVTGTRRRTVEFRRDLACYSGEMERTPAGQHILHIRQHITGKVSVIQLPSSTLLLPELDYMVDPDLTVLAYHCDSVVFSVKDKTKNIPKVILFCDVRTKELVGHFATPVNYNNLSGVTVSCSSSVDGSNFVVFVMEDHYDEFNLAMYALHFENGKPQVSTIIIESDGISILYALHSKCLLVIVTHTSN